MCAGPLLHVDSAPWQPYEVYSPQGKTLAETGCYIGIGRRTGSCAFASTGLRQQLKYLCEVCADAGNVLAHAHLASGAHSSNMPPGGQHNRLLDQDALFSGASN